MPESWYEEDTPEDGIRIVPIWRHPIVPDTMRIIQINIFRIIFPLFFENRLEKGLEGMYIKCYPVAG